MNNEELNQPEEKQEIEQELQENPIIKSEKSSDESSEIAAKDESDENEEPDNESSEIAAKDESDESVETDDESSEITAEDESDESVETDNESSEITAEDESGESEETDDESSEITAEDESDENEESIEASDNVQQKEIPRLGNLANALKNDLKAQVETVLFVTDKPLKTGALAAMLNAPYDDVKSAIIQLIQEYEDRNGGLEIGTDDGYIVQVKTQYLNIVTDMMPLEINPGPLRTLSAIALKEPCLQSEIVDMRGSSAYDQISDLIEMDLVSKKPQGMSYILKTTQKFKTYFRLSQEANQIKEKLQEQAKRIAKEREEKKKHEEDERMAEAKDILEGNTEAKEAETAPTPKSKAKEEVATT